MKKLVTILALAALALPAFGQFVAGPNVGPALATTSGGFKIYDRLEGSNVTTLSYAPSFALNGDGPVSLYLDWGATNGTTGVSNLWFYFQYSADGTKWMGPAAISGNSPALAQGVLGPGAGKQTYWPLITSPGSHGGVNGQGVIITNLANIRYIRLYNVSNHVVDTGPDSNVFYLTNVWFIQR
jgi:hypothetical protein